MNKIKFLAGLEKPVEKTGTYDEIKKLFGDMDPLDWAKNYAVKRTAEEKSQKRFIEQGHCTPDGEVASKTITSLNHEQIDSEAKYDGFYAVCTNLEYDISSMIKINQKRWEIEEQNSGTEIKRKIYL